MCVYLLSAEQKNPGRFLMSGVLGRRRGPDDYLLFPNEMRGDEESSQEVLGFHSVYWMVDMAKVQLQVEPQEELQCGHR